MVDDNSIEEVKERLKAASSIVALTGAGVSAESGVPTFRGASGLWKNFKAEDLATPEAFDRDPALVWEWYGYRRDIVSKVEPNPAHYALRTMEQAGSGFTLITQNVDGLHGLAGSENVLELHGNLWRTKCLSCSNIAVTIDLPDIGLPKCKKESCGGLLRPDIVWFGESLDESIIKGAIYAVDNTDFMIVAGTSAIVHPAASFALRAKGHGAVVVEVNPERTPLSQFADYVLEGKAGEILPRLVE